MSRRWKGDLDSCRDLQCGRALAAVPPPPPGGPGQQTSDRKNGRSLPKVKEKPQKDLVRPLVRRREFHIGTKARSCLARVDQQTADQPRKKPGSRRWSAPGRRIEERQNDASPCGQDSQTRPIADGFIGTVGRLDLASLPLSRAAAAAEDDASVLLLAIGTFFFPHSVVVAGLHLPTRLSSGRPPLHPWTTVEKRNREQGEGKGKKKKRVIMIFHGSPFFRVGSVFVRPIRRFTRDLTHARYRTRFPFVCSSASREERETGREKNLFLTTTTTTTKVAHSIS